ncbi:MAG: hypothetical protein AB1442_01925 [Nitrospirota bacterium]
MKEEIVLNEKIKLLERELATLTEKIEILQKALKEVEDMKSEIKGLKLFLGRAHPDFKKEFPEIIEKIFKKR